jgi:phospholipid-binding lipoprotein MlaA
MSPTPSTRRIAFVFSSVLAVILTPTAEAQNGNRIYTYTTEGVAPVDLNNGRLPKNSSQTYYLESALPNSARAKPTPKVTPKATPKPRATPKPKPTPKSKPTPKPAKIREPEAPKLAPAPAQSTKTTTITVAKKNTSPASSKPASKPAPPSVDDLDDYGDTVKVSDPIEPVNRGIFWINHQLYNYVARPISKVYTTVLPKPVRNAVHNVYENIEDPVRVVNHLLQGQPGRADLETRKFVVNTVGGVGGIMKVSDRFPDLAELPSADTGQTFAKWGIGHGPFVVLPVIGPRSARDTVGFAGDMALNPLTWVPIGGVAQAIALPLTTPNTVRNLDNRLRVYDAATENAVDPYTAVRGAYIQSRDRTTSK